MTDSSLLHRLAFLLAVSFCMTSPLMAEESADAPDRKSELAEELLTLFDIDKNMEAAMAQVTKIQEDMLAQQPNLSEEAKVKQRAAFEASMAETKKIMSWEAMKGDFVKIYADVFTAEELEGMIAFFKGPVGQKFIEKQPQVQAALMQRMQALMAEIQPKVKAAIEKAQAAAAEPAKAE